ncbi:hypothetical protein VTJ49DRAFT_5830 [Mycothermus thermophilus]|uniref:C2H2-type domain-containing protein n=1 Tax=Humicola insolens TaxID=85995 RepID=A0ABR3VKK1_HUMIN
MSTSSIEDAARSDTDIFLVATGSQHAMIEYEAPQTSCLLPQPFDTSKSGTDDTALRPPEYGANMVPLGILFPGAGPEFASNKTKEEVFQNYQALDVEIPVRTHAGNLSTPPLENESNSTVRPATTSRPLRSSTTSKAEEKAKYRCKFTGCGRGASRQADLERHYATVHFAVFGSDGPDALPTDKKKRKYVCDYKMCARHTEPFLRQDHFRDHLRFFHKEDIPRRGARDEGDEWWETRAPCAVSKGWWRCSKCLRRVTMKKHGFTCPDCGRTCERQRQEYRVKLQEKFPAPAAAYALSLDKNAAARSVAASV